MVQRSSFRRTASGLATPGISVAGRAVRPSFTSLGGTVFMGGDDGPSSPEKSYSLPLEMVALSGWNGTVFAGSRTNETMSGSYEMGRMVSFRLDSLPGGSTELLYGRADVDNSTGWFFWGGASKINFTVYSVSGAATSALSVTSADIGKVFILFGSYNQDVNSNQVCELYRFNGGSRTVTLVSSSFAAASGSDGGYKTNNTAIKTVLGNYSGTASPALSFAIVCAAGVDDVKWTTTQMDAMGDEIFTTYKINTIYLDYIPEGGQFVPREKYNMADISGSSYVISDGFENWKALTFTGSVSASVAKVSFVPTFI